MAVRINADGDVNMILGFHKAGEQRVLVSPVARETDASIAGVLPRKLLDDGPGVVFAAVVDEHDMTVWANLLCLDEVLDLRFEELAGDGEHFLLVVAGDYDAKCGAFGHANLRDGFEFGCCDVPTSIGVSLGGVLKAGNVGG